MNNSGKKRPLGEYQGENSGENQTKRRRYDNVVLVRGRRRRRNRNNAVNNDAAAVPQRDIRTGGESSSNLQSRPVTAGKRKKPGDEQPVVPPEDKSADENDIISELTKQFKKARLRPVFFTISSFVEQTVDEVGFTMADEPETTEVTIRLSLPIRATRHHVENAELSDEASLTLSQNVNAGNANVNGSSGGTLNSTAAELGDNYTTTSSVFVFKAGRVDNDGDEDGERKFKKMKTSQD
ncbi:hypothetical protein Ocin01_11026 [Orchesella cincta]|uniref:Uncharacterized protein n=1 Tax=Orchesella cincta TaxID=48709 RepID=A0A1D2MRC1_ORCCI|nr:hypothetical protein Ocin01_11026 [Orchesella cincta]